MGCKHSKVNNATAAARRRHRHRHDACPNCHGCGGFDMSSQPARVGSISCKDACNLCDGSGQINLSTMILHSDAMMLTPCKQCETLGGFDCWGKPARFVSLHYQNHCSCCQGKGFILEIPQKEEVVVEEVPQLSSPPMLCESSSSSSLSSSSGSTIIDSAFSSSRAITGFLLERDEGRSFRKLPLL